MAKSAKAKKIDIAYPDGSYYSGQVVNRDRRHGVGKLTWKDSKIAYAALLASS